MMSRMRVPGDATRWRRRAAMAMLSLAAALPAAHADCKFKRVATIPVEWVDVRLTLAGSINDTPMQMVVDTGAQRTVVSGPLAEKLKLPLVHVNNVQVGVGGRSEESMSRLDELSLGRYQWHRAKVAVVWNSGGHLPDVLVGAAALFERDVELTDQQMSFFSGTDCEDAELGYWADGVPWVPMFAKTAEDLRVKVTVQVNGVPVLALVDSGAPFSVLDATVARRLGFEPDDPALRTGVVGGIGKHLNAVSVIALDSLAIGPEIVKRPRIQVTDLWGSAQHDLPPTQAGDFFAARPTMILGADFVRSHRLLFANSQHRLYFSYLGGEVIQVPRPAALAAATAPAAASAPVAAH